MLLLWFQKQRWGLSVLFDDLLTDNEVFTFSDDKQDLLSQPSGKVLMAATSPRLKILSLSLLPF